MLDNSHSETLDVVDQALGGIKAFNHKFGLRPTPEDVAALLVKQAEKVFTAGTDLDDEDPVSVEQYLKALTDHAFYAGAMVIARENHRNYPQSEIEEKALTTAGIIGLGRNMTLSIADWDITVYQRVIAEAFRRVITANLTRSHDLGEDLKVPKGDDYVAPDLLDLAEELIDSAK